MSGAKIHFSVIIPARNEQSYITETIKSIKAQDYKGKFEIIVVNNASVDNTEAVVKKLGVSIVNESRVGLPQARETGRLAANGEFLVYVDADTHLPSNYLSTIDRKFHSSKNIVAISNPFTFYDGNAVHNHVIQGFFGFIYPLQNFLLTILGKSNQLLGGNFAVRASTLEEIGGFNTNILFYGEDLALSKELARFGKIVILHKLYSQTSARRFRAYGTLRTSFLYFKNFFSVLFFNRDSYGSIARQITYTGLVVVGTIFALRYIHLGHYLLKNKDENLERLLVLSIVVFFYGLLHPRSKLFGPALSRFNTSEPIIALTFDDGPRSNSTPKVLDILKREGVHATFFLVGNHVEAHPELVRRIQAEGHEIGNHTYSHKWRFPFMWFGYLSSEVDHTEQKIKEITNSSQMGKKLFRPPHGWRTPWMFSELYRKNYEIIMWDIALDFLPGVTTEQIKKRFINKTRAGSILLLHDAIWERPKDERGNMLAALPIIIRELKAKGYRFVRVGDML